MMTKHLELYETRLESQRIYDGKIINLRLDTVRLPNEKEAKREVVEHPGAVAIVAVNEQQEIIMIKQYRYPIDEVIWEVPAGKLEKGENPDDSAARELEEETGYQAKVIKRIARFYTTPGFTDEVMYLYLAQGLTLNEQNLDEDEFLTVEKMPLTKAVELIFQGEIVDNKTIVAILMAKELVKE
jgi:ADP-ribose pyrophosphatase